MITEGGLDEDVGIGSGGRGLVLVVEEDDEPVVSVNVDDDGIGASVPNMHVGGDGSVRSYTHNRDPKFRPFRQL